MASDYIRQLPYNQTFENRATRHWLNINPSLFQGASLASMAGFLTYGNRKYEALDNQMRKLLPPLYASMKTLLPFVDADAAAFNDYMVCLFVWI